VGVGGVGVEVAGVGVSRGMWATAFGAAVVETAVARVDDVAGPQAESRAARPIATDPPILTI
jgi:hypothetical protein